MKIAITLLALLVFTGCSATDGVSDLFDRLEFKEGQEGCIRANGQVSVGNNPLASTSINVNMVKKQGDDAPDC